jgi:3-oxoadipate enol-lactonase
MTSIDSVSQRSQSHVIDGLHVEVAGDGAAVVLVHAGIADSRMWEPQWATWPDDYRVIRLDLREFGRSATAVSAFCHATDVLAVLDAVEIERAILVGASFGGLVSLDLAASRPDRIAALVLADIPLPDHAWSAQFETFGDAENAAIEAGDLDLATEINVDFWLGGAPEPIRSAIREQQRRAFELQVGVEAESSLLTEDLPERLAGLDVPTLVVDGAEDVADFREIADYLGRTIPGSERATVAGSGHLPSLEQPEAFDAIVRPFLARVV